MQTSASIALFATTFVQGHTTESNAWAREALALSEQCPDLAAQAHMAVGGSALSLRQVVDGGEHLARSCALAGEIDSLPIGTRTAVHAGAWGAHALWLLGKEEEARVRAEDSVRLAESIEHPYSLAVALAYAVVTHQMRGDLAALESALAALTAVCERYELAYYGQWAVVLSGWLRGGEAGIAQTQQGIRNLEREGSFARVPYWFWLLADLHRTAGDRDAAVATLDAAESVAMQNADVWWLPRCSAPEQRSTRHRMGRTTCAVRRQWPPATPARACSCGVEPTSPSAPTSPDAEGRCRGRVPGRRTWGEHECPVGVPGASTSARSAYLGRGRVPGRRSSRNALRTPRFLGWVAPDHKEPIMTTIAASSLSTASGRRCAGLRDRAVPGATPGRRYAPGPDGLQRHDRQTSGRHRPLRGCCGCRRAP